MTYKYYISGASTEGSWRNRLVHSRSVYLRQHGEQPINWYPWGAEAFELAQKNNLPVLVSVGYSACHWCHVMARESFSDLTVASILNEHFVAIKVDRESQPEVDAFCIQVLLQLQGDAGWPTNIFLSPDKVPLMGGTYYPLYYQYGLPGFADVLRNVDSLWRQGPERFAETGRQILSMFAKQPADSTELRFIASQWESELDDRHGGFGWGSKFPMVPRLDVMLTHLDSPAWRKALIRHLDALDTGGIHDHVGGGFHRYAVDVDWVVPHYEKMLCDNALIARAFLRAHALLDNPHYRAVGCDTLEWILQDMSLDDGLFAASFDAEDPMGEGYYYTWTQQELRSALGEKAERIISAYDIGEYGNTDIGRSTMVRKGHASVMASVRQKLRAFRSQRPAPKRDDKAIAAWNAMVGSALCMGYRMLFEHRYLDVAIGIGKQLIAAALPLIPRVLGSERVGTLEDQAWTLDLWFELYSCTADPIWLEAASRLIPAVLSDFAHPDLGFQLQHRKAAIPVAIPCADDHSEHAPLAVLMRVLDIAVTIGGLGLKREELEGIWDRLRIDISAATLCGVQRERRALSSIVLTDVQQDRRLWKQALKNWRSYAYVFPESDFETPLLNDRRGKGVLAWICKGQQCRIPLSVDDEWPQLSIGP